LCAKYHDDFVATDWLNTKVLIITVCIIVAFHILYFIFFYTPLLCCLVYTRRNIMDVYKHIPKDITGNIYHTLANKHNVHLDAYIRKGAVIGPIWKILLVYVTNDNFLLQLMI